MTLVQNRLQLLSGNRYLLFAAIGLLLAACSPKVRPVAVVPRKPVDTVVTKKPEVKPTPPPARQVSVISLLLPFYLDEIDLGKGAPRASFSKATLALDYYQGFKLALDSLAVSGHNFKLQVFDTHDGTAQVHNLALNTKVRTSSVIVGPIFPEEIKSFTLASPSLRKMLVSPLSPTPPANYSNPDLVTMIPPLMYHCRLVADYIHTHLHAKKVFILRSGYSEDNKYIIPFKRAIDSLSGKKIRVVELTVVRGNLSPLLSQLSTTEQNIFVVPATDQQFLQVTLRSLDLLNKQHHPVTLFGHPNWEDATYLKPELLQRLNTYITSGDRVNYHSPRVISFLREYRRIYHTEPGEFAIKGFDEGMYLGRLVIAEDRARLASANKNVFIPGKAVMSWQDAAGLHNTFHFAEVPGMGYVNTHVTLYKYANFELKPVE